jgi:hypothetical protein
MSAGAYGSTGKGGGGGKSKSAGSAGGKKGLVTSPFQKPVAGRKIGKGGR